MKAIQLTANQLNDIMSPITEDEIITRVASTLPPYRHVMAVWENHDDTTARP